MDHHTIDMQAAKNAYLVQAAVATSMKNRFFQADFPSVHNDFQSLWDVTTGKVVSVFTKAGSLSKAHRQRLLLHSDNGLAALATVSAEQDQNLFIEHNRRPFFEPADFPFEPCPIWHDTPDFLVANPEPKTLLQNRLAAARARIASLEPESEAKRKEAEGLVRLRDKCMTHESLGDVDDATENGFESTRQAVLLEMQLTAAVKEAEVLEEALGSASSPSLGVPSLTRKCLQAIKVRKAALRPRPISSFGRLGTITLVQARDICSARHLVRPSPRAGRPQPESSRDSNLCGDQIWGLNKSAVTCKVRPRPTSRLPRSPASRSVASTRTPSANPKCQRTAPATHRCPADGEQARLPLSPRPIGPVRPGP